MAGLSWAQAWLVGAVLSPTDPVFAAAIVGRSDVPRRLRHLLNVESGVNDGLALPAVIVLLAVVGEREVETLKLLEELALGVALGIAIPWMAIKLERLRFFQAAARYQPLYAFAIGLLVFGAGSLLHASLFLAAFAAASPWPRSGRRCGASSTLAHSSTDVLVARWFREEKVRSRPSAAAEEDRRPAGSEPDRTPASDRSDGEG